MKKRRTDKLLGLATLTVGAVLVGKLIHDIKKIKALTAEKEEALAEDVEVEAAPAEEIVDETVEEVAEEEAAEEVAEEATEEVTEEATEEAAEETAEEDRKSVV